MIRLPLLFVATALVGCRSSGNVWLVEVNTKKGDAYACSTKASTNYAGTLAEETESSGPITDSYDSSTSSILFYVKMVDLDKGSATLNSGDLLLPGTETDGGKWEFAWALTDTRSSRTRHEDGYTLETVEDEADRTSIVLTLDGDTATGNMTIANVETQTIRETDVWTEEVADDVGRDGRLYWVDSEDEWDGNDFETADCTSDPCMVEATTNCGASAPITATRTDLSDDGDFASLAGLVNYGSFKTSSSSSYGGDDTGGGWDSGWAVGR